MSNARKKLGFTQEALAKHALFAVRNGSFVRLRGNCLRFVREVVSNLKPNAWPLEIGPNAWEAANRLEKLGYGIPLSQGSQVGDLLFKKPTENNAAGHVGIRVPGNRVAENSSYHAASDDDDARGVRTLKQFGTYHKIIRLGDDFNGPYPR